MSGEGRIQRDASALGVLQYFQMQYLYLVVLPEHKNCGAVLTDKFSDFCVQDRSVESYPF